MQAVLHIPTGRIVYREQPEPPDARLLSNCIALQQWEAKDLVVIEIAQSEWLRELALRDEERPVPLEDRLSALEERVKALE
jgi:hypothetical protein